MLNDVKSAFRENRLAIIISTAILIASLVLGYFLEPYAHAYFSPIVDELTRKVQSGAIRLTFTDIFLNNFKIIVWMFISGLIFCFSALILAFNGFFVGYYVACSQGLLEVLLYIIPHGIFEFSSCILACSSGFVLFNFVYKFIKAFLSQKDNSISEKLRNSYDSSYIKLKQACIIFAVSVILMAVAGFVEAYLTLPIARFVLSFLS